MRIGRTSVLVLLALLAPRGGVAQGTRSPDARAARHVTELRFGRELQSARAGETAAVFVSAHDAEGRPADASVALDCDFGELGPLVRVTEGLYRASLTVPQVLPSGRTILLLARAGAVSAESILPVGPAAAATMKLGGPRAVLADGESRARLDVRLADAYGNPADEVPRASAALGTLRPAQRIGPGRWSIEYLPHRILDEAKDVLAVEAGSLRSEHALRLTARQDWMAVAPWAGLVLASGDGVALGAGASWWRRRGESQLGLVLDLAWWSLDEQSALVLPGGPVELDGERSYLPATVSVAWGRRLGRRALASLSAGGGAARVTSAQRLAGQPAVSEAGWSPAATGALAFGLRAWRGLPFVELRALWIGDPGLETLRGSTRPLLVLVGYRFDGR